MSEPDTIFALSSGRPPAAISIIRVSGPRAHQAALRLAGSLPEARTAAVRELRNPSNGELLDEALVLRFDAPASSTGEDTVELHCHGGRAVTDAVLAALGGIDRLRVATPGEFTRRAFENGRIDLTEAEGLADLIEAETESQRKAALARADGGLRGQIRTWQESVLGLSARAERAIDYDDDDEAVHPALLLECKALADELDEWLARPRIETLKDGVLVVIAGPPNVGKSSLINVLSGDERAIVTDVPGTTRDHIEVSVSLAGVPIRLTDTAGLRLTTDRVEAIGVERAGRLVEAADILIWLGNPGQAPSHHRLILVHTKADLPERGCPPRGSLAVSAVSQAGIPELLQQIETLSRSMLPAEDAISLNRRQAARIAEARDGLSGASSTRDPVLLAESLRQARIALNRLTGTAGFEEVLDALFGRFCLGK